MTKSEKYNKVFNASLDSLGVRDAEARCEAKLYRTEDELIAMIERLIPNSNIYMYVKESTAKFGCTYPMFGDSAVVPEGHMVHISTQNYLVLTHELAHVVDYERKSRDAHDARFNEVWRELLDKI